MLRPRRDRDVPKHVSRPTLRIPASCEDTNLTKHCFPIGLLDPENVAGGSRFNFIAYTSFADIISLLLSRTLLLLGFSLFQIFRPSFELFFRTFCLKLGMFADTYFYSCLQLREFFTEKVVFTVSDVTDVTQNELLPVASFLCIPY
jgi:hypothetical protein